MKYLIKIPELEIEADYAKEAILQALEYFKKNTIKVNWSEIN